MCSKLILTRVDQNDERTLGKLEMFDENKTLVFECVTLELGWHNNQKRISRFPKGRYPLLDRNQGKYATRYGNKWGHKFVVQIGDIENRTNVLIHRGNGPAQTLGCLLVAENYGPRRNTIRSSTTAYKRWYTAYTLYNPKELVVREQF